MKTISIALMIWILAAHNLGAQLDLLTPGETTRIVAQIPDVVEAVKKLGCPMLADVTGDPRHPDTVDVEVRARCNGVQGSLRYVVNRRTGAVTTWGDDPHKVGGRASELLAEQLVRQARSRVLTLRESRCLAVEAARSLPGWGNAASPITIAPGGAPPVGPETLFQLGHKSLSPPGEVVASLFVDPRTGLVRDEGSAAQVMSAGLGELLAKLIGLRSPPLLSDQDALSITVKVPAFAAIARRENCSLIVSSARTPEEAWVAPACDGHYLDRPRLAVNLRDGLVLDGDTMQAIDAPEAVLLARSLVATARDTRRQLQEEVDARCGGPYPH